MLYHRPGFNGNITKLSGTVSIDFWSFTWSGRDFQAKSSCRFGKPGTASERAAAIDAALDHGKLLVSLRGIDAFYPSSPSPNSPNSRAGIFVPVPTVRAVATAQPPGFGSRDPIRPHGVSLSVPADRQ